MPRPLADVDEQAEESVPLLSVISRIQPHRYDALCPVFVVGIDICDETVRLW